MSEWGGEEGVRDKVTHSTHTPIHTHTYSLSQTDKNAHESPYLSLGKMELGVCVGGRRLRWVTCEV